MKFPLFTLEPLGGPGNMTENSTRASKLDLVLAGLGWQGHLVEVVKVGVAHRSLG